MVSYMIEISVRIIADIYKNKNYFKKNLNITTLNEIAGAAHERSIKI